MPNKTKAVLLIVAALALVCAGFGGLAAIIYSSLAIVTDFIALAQTGDPVTNWQVAAVLLWRTLYSVGGVLLMMGIPFGVATAEIAARTWKTAVTKT